MMDVVTRAAEAPWAIGATIMVSIFVLLAVIIVLIFRRYVPAAVLKKHHDVAGYVFTNIGVLYAVLLGFTVVNAQERFDKIKDAIEVEASFLSELYRDVEVFPEKSRQELQDAIKEYCRSVVHEEWALLAEKKASASTAHALNTLWHGFYNLDPKTQKEEIWYAESINKLNKLMKSRMKRILSSRDSLGSEMWSLLILGGIVMTVFMCFFGLDSGFTHALMAGILAATAAFMLFLIYSLDSAFSGSVSASPDAIQRALDALK